MTTALCALLLSALLFASDRYLASRHRAWRIGRGLALGLEPLFGESEQDYRARVRRTLDHPVRGSRAYLQAAIADALRIAPARVTVETLGPGRIEIHVRAWLWWRRVARLALAEQTALAHLPGPVALAMHPAAGRCIDVALWPILGVHARPGLGWLRVLGLGVAWKDTRRHGLVFSERAGLRKRLRIGAWRVGVVWPDRVWWTVRQGPRKDVA